MSLALASLAPDAWIGPRRFGLLAFAATGTARESNKTAPVGSGGRAATIYWQTRAWLSAEGLIECDPTSPARAGVYRLASTGRSALDGMLAAVQTDFVDVRADPAAASSSDARAAAMRLHPSAQRTLQ